jgi:hypothetical protein
VAVPLSLTLPTTWGNRATPGEALGRDGAAVLMTCSCLRFSHSILITISNHDVFREIKAYFKAIPVRFEMTLPAVVDNIMPFSSLKATNSRQTVPSLNFGILNMNSDQESCSEWDRSTLVNENYANFRDTFCQDPADSKLQVTRFYENIAEDGNERPGYCVHPSPITFSDQIEYYAVRLYSLK